MESTKRNLQLVEYDMLKDITFFCEKNKIDYFIIAGTLLGAVRHGGFIPWDDDIDIGMDLHNYKKFLKLAKSTLDKKYFIQNFKTDPKINNPWTKIRLNGTTSMDPRLTDFEVHSGVSMDIFLFNGISKNRLRKKIQIYSSKRQRQLLKKYYHLEGKGTGECRRINKVIPEFLRRFLISILDKIINIDLSRTECCYNTFFEGVYKPYCYQSSWFKNLKRIKFENDMFYAPVNPEDYLVARYGDWQTPPPENERVAHGDIIVDLNNNYTIYQSERLKNKS